LKFGDVVTAVASTAVLMVLTSYPLGFVLDMQTSWGQWANSGISIFLSTLIVGLVFAGKIWEEARIRAILRIVVVGAVLFIFYMTIRFTSSDFISWVSEANPHPEYTAANWYDFDGIVLSHNLFLNVVFLLVVSFIGLYIGSLLRKPTMSQK
jgi:hypothetical protein